MNIGPAKELELLLHNGNDQDFQRADDNQAFLMKLAKLSKITWLNEGDEIPMATTHLVGQMEVLVPMAGLIDKDKEIARLGKRSEEHTSELQRISKKLG